MTTILIKKKDTAGAPAAGDLTNAAGGAEIAVNTATKRIYSKDSGGTIIEMGTFPSVMAVQGNLSATGTGSITGDFAVNTNKFTVAASTGNVAIAGTLQVAGGINFNGNVTVGDSSADTLTVNSTITSNLIFTDNTYDIGASGATRPRTGYFGTSLVSPVVGAASGSSLSLRANATTYMTILGAGTNNGYVGVGTAAPYSLFSNIASSPGWSIASDAISWQATGTGYATSLVAAPASGYSYGLRVHTVGNTDSDSILALTGGAGTGAYAMIVTGSGKAIIGPTGTATYRLRVYDTQDCAIGIDGYGASAAAQIWLSSGNGTTSPAYAYISHKNNQTSPQEWRVGTYGGSSYSIYNNTSTTYAFNITSGNIATFGPVAKTDAKLNLRYNAGAVLSWGGDAGAYDKPYGYLTWSDGGTYAHPYMWAATGMALAFGVNGNNSASSPDMYLNVSGYLSIGAGISPNGAIHVKKSTATIIAESTTATANADIHFKSTAQTWGVGLNMQYTGGQLEFYDYNAGTNRAFFDTTGILTVTYQSASQRFVGSSDQTITNNNYTLVDLAVNKFTQNITYTANGKFTATAAGKYLVTFFYRFQSGSGFAAEARVDLNGSYYTYEYVNSYTQYQQMMCSVIVNMAYGDYVELKAWQSSGSSKDITGNSLSSGAYIYKLC